MDNFFENRRFFEIRERLKLDQKGFADAIGMHQSGISKIEMNVNGISRRTKAKVCDTFYIDPLFFESGSGASMFLEGKEEEALKVAEGFLPPKSIGKSQEKSHSKEPLGTVDSHLLDIQAIRIEKLTAELELTKDLLRFREEILKSKEELIVVLKEQLEMATTNYEKLSKEISELKELLSRKEGESDDPNGLHPVKSSG